MKLWINVFVICHYDKFQCLFTMHRNTQPYTPHLFSKIQKSWRWQTWAINCRKIHKQSTTSKTQNSIPHAAVPCMFSYTYLTGKKKTSAIFKIPFHIQFYILVFLPFYVYTIIVQKLSNIKKKHSLKFEIRHLWDADGDPYRLWMPDELYLHRLSATDEKWSDVLI